MAPKNQIQPYENDAEYLDSEVEHLRLRLARIETEKRLGDAERAATESADTNPRSRRPGVPELRGTLHELAHKEQQARDEIDARLTMQRADTDASELGLDRLCREYDLGAEERLLLTALVVPAVSKELADLCLREQGGFCGRLSVGELSQVLYPQSVGDWLKARRLFRPEAPLVKHGLVDLDAYGKRSTAETLMNANIELTLKAFAVIFSDPDAESEVPTDDSSDQ